jgi:hypothetical protein
MSIEGQTYSFNQGDLIVYDNQWRNRPFFFGGLIGSGSALTNSLTMTIPTQRPTNISLSGSWAPGNQTDPFTDNNPNGNLTLKHRLLQRLISQTSKIKASVINKFSVSELTEIARWIDAGIDENNAGTWSA